MSAIVDRSGEAFARLLAHDLRAPMGPLVLAVSSLAEDPGLDGGAREISRLALAQAERMMRLLQATLWTLRAPDDALGSFHLADVARDAVACAEGIGVACITRIDADVRAHGDPQRVRDALAGVLEVTAAATASVTMDVRKDAERIVLAICGPGPIEEPCDGAPSDAPAALLQGARALFRAYGGGMTFDGSGVTAWLRAAS